MVDRKTIKSYAIIAICVILLIICAINILIGDWFLGLFLLFLVTLSLYKGVVFKETVDPHGIVYGRRLQ